MKSQPSQLSSNHPPPEPNLRPRALWFFSISVTIVFLLLGSIALLLGIKARWGAV